VVNFVKLWTSAVLFYCAFCTILLLTAFTFGAEVGATQWVALLLLIVMGITIISPAMDIWGQMPTLKKWRNENVSFPSCSCNCRRNSDEKDEPLMQDQEQDRTKYDQVRGSKRAWCDQFFRWCRKRFFQFGFWVRKTSWVLRWIIDLGLPMLVIVLNSAGAQDLVGISAWAQGMSGFGFR